MTLRTTFPVLSSGTRDLTANIGDVYVLDGSSNTSRLSIANGATVQFGDDTTVLYSGAVSHSFMNGTIEGKRFKIIIGHTSGRGDFSTTTGSFKVEDITFCSYAQGGDVFLHLEDTGNLSEFKGTTRVILNTASGVTTYVQFADKEYPRVNIELISGNQFIYVARDQTGTTYLPGLTVSGLGSTLTIYKGSKATSAGVIIDPVYVGKTNNEVNFTLVRPVSSSNNIIEEYFSLDITAIRVDTLRVRIVTHDASNTVTTNDLLATVANTSPTANGSTALAFFSGRAVFLMRVRVATETLNAGSSGTSRNNITYTLRQATHHEIQVKNQRINGPVVISEMMVDDRYTTSTAVTGISLTAASKLITVADARTLQDVYNYCKQKLSSAGSMSIDNFVSLSGVVLDLKDWSLLVSGTGAALTSTDNINTIKTTETVSTGTTGTLAASILIDDKDGDSLATSIIPPEYTTLTIHNTQSDADDGKDAIATGLTFRYKSSELGGKTYYARLVGTNREAVSPFIVPSTKGRHVFEILISETASILQQLRSELSDNKTLLIETRDHAKACNIQTQPPSTTAT